MSIALGKKLCVVLIKVVWGGRGWTATKQSPEDPGTSSCQCYYRSYPRVCSILCTGYTLSSTGSAEFSGVEAIHTWAGDVLGRGPYQAITALNSLRYRLGRYVYPVVARRCLASY